MTTAEMCAPAGRLTTDRATQEHRELAGRLATAERCDNLILKVNHMSIVISDELRKLVAIHEAGHAVIARVLGVAVHRVSMIPGGLVKNSNSAGVVTESASDGRGLDGFEIDLKIALAGMAAQYRRFPDTFSMDDMAGHAGADMLNASTLALAIALRDAEMTPAETTEITEALDDAAAFICGDFARKTDDLVVEHWPAIKRVGYALVERDVLDQSELDALIKGTA